MRHIISFTNLLRGWFAGDVNYVHVDTAFLHFCCAKHTVFCEEGFGPRGLGNLPHEHLNPKEPTLPLEKLSQATQNKWDDLLEPLTQADDDGRINWLIGHEQKRLQYLPLGDECYFRDTWATVETHQSATSAGVRRPQLTPLELLRQHMGSDCQAEMTLACDLAQIVPTKIKVRVPGVAPVNLDINVAELPVMEPPVPFDYEAYGRRLYRERWDDMHDVVRKMTHDVAMALPHDIREGHVPMTVAVAVIEGLGAATHDMAFETTGYWGDSMISLADTVKWLYEYFSKCDAATKNGASASS